MFIIERPAQHIVTAASGPRAEALALVLPDSELPAFWTLHLDDINWTQPTVGNNLKGWLSRDSNPDLGSGRHGRRRGRSGTGAFDPTSRARYTGRNMHNYNIITNVSIAPYPVFGFCTLAVQWRCMRTVCRRSRVRILFAFFPNRDQHRYELECTGMYWYVPVCTSMDGYIQVCTDMC